MACSGMGTMGEGRGVPQRVGFETRSDTNRMEPEGYMTMRLVNKNLEGERLVSVMVQSCRAPRSFDEAAPDGNQEINPTSNY